MKKKIIIHNLPCTHPDAYNLAAPTGNWFV